MQTNRQDWPWDSASDRKRKTRRERDGEDGKHVSPVSLHVWVRLREVWNDDGVGKVIQSCFFKNRAVIVCLLGF